MKAVELDKAFGQILRHQELFTTENSIPSERVKIAIACPEFPDFRRRMFESAGIRCFVLASQN